MRSLGPYVNETLKDVPIKILQIWQSMQKHPNFLTKNSSTKRNLLDKLQLKLEPCFLMETLRGVRNQPQDNIYPVILENLEVRPRLETEVHTFCLFYVSSFFFFFFFFLQKVML